MVQKLLILDTSIILNMLSVNSLEMLLSVDREFCTTDFVLNTIRKSICKGTFAKLEKSQKLKIYSIDKDVEKFFEFHLSLRNLLTIEGCSVLFHAKKTNATLLSSDRNLLDVAKKNDIRSFDLLDVLECMIKKNILSKKRGCREFNRINGRKSNIAEGGVRKENRSLGELKMPEDGKNRLRQVACRDIAIQTRRQEPLR